MTTAGHNDARDILDGKFSEKTLETIFNRVAEGEPLSRICNEPDMPSRVWFFRKVKADATIRERYQFALEMRAELYADETPTIADEVPDGTLDSQTFNARQRLRVDTRKWYAASLAPKKYGQKVALGGSDEMPPIKSVTATGSPEEVYRALLAGGKLTEAPPDGSEFV